MAKTKIELFEDSLIEEGLHFFLLCQKESSFARSFVDHEFVLALANFIVADHYSNSSEKDKAYATIVQILQPDYTGPLYTILKKHRYEEKLNLTNECLAFLEKISVEQ